MYPGMTDAKLDYMAKVLCEAVRGKKYETTKSFSPAPAAVCVNSHGRCRTGRFQDM